MAARTWRPQEGPGEFEELLRGGFSKEKLTAFFIRRPHLVARRIGEIATVFLPVRDVWQKPGHEAERGESLRRALSQLGPVFVKVGQTLAQRPDLVGTDVAEELKSLQTRAEPFSDAVAHRTILEDLGHRGPVAPGICPPGCDPSLPALFASFSDGPVAAASLGQVYQARTHDGVLLAVKVQRPNIARTIALDWTCGVFGTKLHRTVFGAFNDFSMLADEVASAIFLELDYHNEARNMEEFIELHRWLGFVTAPRWRPEYTGPKGTARVLSTEWVDGRRFGDLPKSMRRGAVQMATEACLVQLLITGMVHADPHEGNLLYTEDGRIAFLDFGLVDRVSVQVMESFAEGLKNIVAGDWYVVASSLQAMQWTTQPVQRKLPRRRFSGPRFEECPFEEFVEALGTEMENDPAARVRLGPMVAALRRLSDRFLMLTPPYFLLLTRTFVTLEGIAERIDPDFNIYTMALPVTMRRMMTPVSVPAREALRSSVLTADGEIRWHALEGLLNTSGGVVFQAPGSLFQPLDGLLGSPAGITLRRVAYDVDAAKLLRFLASPRGRPWRRRATGWLAGYWEAQRRGPAKAAQLRAPDGAASATAIAQSPIDESSAIRAQWDLRRRRVLNVIFRSHYQRLSMTLLGGCLAGLLTFILAARITGAAYLLFLGRRLRGAGAGLRLAMRGGQLEAAVAGVCRILVLPAALLASLERSSGRGRQGRRGAAREGERSELNRGTAGKEVETVDGAPL